MVRYQLADTQLVGKFKVVRTGGVAMAAATAISDNVSVINYFPHSLINTVTIEVNGRQSAELSQTGINESCLLLFPSY